MHVVSRNVKGHRIWYADVNFYDPKRDRFRRRKRSTRVRDDGTAASRKRAEAVGAKWEQAVALGRDSGGRSETLAGAFKKLETARELAGAPKPSRDRVSVSFAALCAVIQPDAKLDDLDTPKLTAAAAESIRKGRAPDTVKRDFADLRAAFGAAGIHPPKWPKFPQPRTRDRWLTPEECARLLASLPEKRRNHIWLMLHTGCRKSELWKLGPTLVAGKLHIVDTKTPKANRWIPTTEQVRTIVSEGPLEWWSNLDRDLRRCSKEAGLGPISCNDLRRTFATHLAIAGVPQLHLQHLMGHTTGRMLEQVYARVGAGQHMADAIAKLPAIGVPDVFRK